MPLKQRRNAVSPAQVIRVSSAQGSRYSARWGFSLDFVPIQRSGRMQWKRTAKTASFDLCVDPIDQAGKVSDSWYVSRFIFPLKSYDWSKFTRTVKNATFVAQPNFSRVRSRPFTADTTSKHRITEPLALRRASGV
jgi:hypothetical protein